MVLGVGGALFGEPHGSVARLLANCKHAPQGPHTNQKTLQTHRTHRTHRPPTPPFPMVPPKEIIQLLHPCAHSTPKSRLHTNWGPPQPLAGHPRPGSEHKCGTEPPLAGHKSVPQGGKVSHAPDNAGQDPTLRDRPPPLRDNCNVIQMKSGRAVNSGLVRR